jgi:hypothetical protein
MPFGFRFYPSRGSASMKPVILRKKIDWDRLEDKVYLSDTICWGFISPFQGFRTFYLHAQGFTLRYSITPLQGYCSYRPAYGEI